MAVSKEICAAQENSILTQKVLASVGKLFDHSRHAARFASGAGADSSAVVTLAGRSGAAWGSVARPARASRGV